jgi:hypothetical protein
MSRPSLAFRIGLSAIMLTMIVACALGIIMCVAIVHDLVVGTDTDVHRVRTTAPRQADIESCEADRVVAVPVVRYELRCTPAPLEQP